ncbi:DUF4915 domain-containing protein [Nocardioides sp.]|uniref:DUF4915 domain-containing protein n=1 Tax=Nocardioides sp. TaxID=35761 RepID=UPI0026018538|nr:DUF4915 domain-containing protein [Nocardioides sp.]
MLSINASPSADFVSWLAAAGTSLMVSTGDKLLTLGVDGSRLVVDELKMDVVMGVAAGPGRSLYAASRWQLHDLRDALDGAAGPAGEDQLLINQRSHTTGFIGVRDIAVDGRGRVLFTTALCNGVATLGDRLNFDLVYRPPFVSQDVAEERCHVTGLALDEEGELAYVTCAAETDEPAGWLGVVAEGGVVVDVRSGSVLARGLSLPSSPRLHDSQLYVANAGTGELLRLDRGTGATTRVVALPGLARGLAFVAGRAIVGCSMPPDEGPYAGLPIARIPPHKPRHGLAVVDLASGTVEHTLTLEAGSGDVHSVAIVDDARRVGIRWHNLDTDGYFVLENHTD